MFVYKSFSGNPVLFPKKRCGPNLSSPFKQSSEFCENRTIQGTTVLFRGKQPSEDIRVIRNILFNEYLCGKTSFAEMMRKALNPEIDPRLPFLQNLGRELGVPLNYAGTGPFQKDFRGIFSDIDLDTDSKSQYERLVDKVKKQGYHPEEKVLYTEIPEMDFLIWKPLELVSNLHTSALTLYDNNVLLVLGQEANKYALSLGYIEKAIPALHRPYDMGDGIDLYCRMIAGYKSVSRLMSILGLTKVTIGTNPISGNQPITQTRLQDFIKMRIPPEEFGLHLAAGDPERFASILAHQKVLFKLLHDFNYAIFSEIYKAPAENIFQQARKQTSDVSRQRQNGVITGQEYINRTYQIWATYDVALEKLDNIVRQARNRFDAMWRKYPEPIMRRLSLTPEELERQWQAFKDREYWQFGLA